MGCADSAVVVCADVRERGACGLAVVVAAAAFVVAAAAHPPTSAS